MNEPRTLRSLVLAAQQQRGGASGRELARAAQKRGFKVTFTTLNAIAAGTYKSKPSPDTIRAIGWLAGVPEKVAFAAAGVPMPGPPFADELPPGVDNLTPRSRRAAIEVLRALVEAEQRVGGERADSSAPKAPAGESPASKVHDLNQPDQDRDMDARVAELLAGPHAARRGVPDHLPDDTTGEESQAGPEGGQ